MRARSEGVQAHMHAYPYALGAIEHVCKQRGSARILAGPPFCIKVQLGICASSEGVRAHLQASPHAFRCSWALN